MGRHCRLEGCERVFLVNTGTSVEAIVSAVARLAEHIAAQGSLEGSCFLLATTSSSVGAAGEAVEKLESVLGAGLRIVLDREACGTSLYSGVFSDPLKAYDGLREALHGYRLAGIDITGGLKIEAFLATNLAWAAARQQEGTVAATYTPGEGFGSSSIAPVEDRRFGGWWGGRSYPWTPRRLQRLFITVIPSMEQGYGGCSPIHKPPSRLDYAPLSAQRLEELVAEATRLLNALTCDSITVDLCSAKAPERCTRILEASWEELNIEWAVWRNDGWADKVLSNLGYGEPTSTRGGSTFFEFSKCLERLGKLIYSVPGVEECTHPLCSGEKYSWLHELLADITATGTGNGLLMDTSSIVNGASTALRLAETLFTYRGQRPRHSLRAAVHPCVEDEIGYWLTEYAKKQAGGEVNPCTGYALAAKLHAAIYERADDAGGGGRSCDTAQINYAKEKRLALATSDRGIAYTARLEGVPYILVSPRQPTSLPDPPRKHAIAAAVAQAIALLAAAIHSSKGHLRVSGDRGTALIRTDNHHIGAHIKFP